MEARELMLGNWVLDLKTNTESKVTGILEDGSYLDGAVSVANRIFDIRPIPITEEWLVKFGFEESEDYEYSIKYPSVRLDSVLSQFAIVIWLDNTFECFLDTPQTPNKKDGKTTFERYPEETFLASRIKYVHQLQNLFYSITGKSLETK